MKIWEFGKVGASDFASAKQLMFKNMSDAADAKGEDADFRQKPNFQVVWVYLISGLAHQKIKSQKACSSSQGHDKEKITGWQDEQDERMRQSRRCFAEKKPSCSSLYPVI